VGFASINDLLRLLMNQLIVENPPSEAPASVERQEACSVSDVRRIEAMLDLDPERVTKDALLPRGWHFVLLGADTRRSALRADGFPGLGVPMPDLGLPRLLLGGRTTSYLKDIPIGSHLTRTSAMQNLKRKTTEAGPMAIATISHALRLHGDNEPALLETQTYLLLPARHEPAAQDVSHRSAEITATRTATFVPDETLLFQYSALGFNSHKIHIDRSHASQVEGFPGLVVNGGLATLHMTEFLRRDLGLVPTAIRVRHVAPLYCGRPITMTADPEGQNWRLKAYDHRNILAIDMEAEIQ
jgi:3-methylfumaryl-CoA hydratase